MFGGEPSHVNVNTTPDRRQASTARNVDESEARRLVKRIPWDRTILHRVPLYDGGNIVTEGRIVHMRVMTREGGRDQAGVGDCPR